MVIFEIYIYVHAFLGFLKELEHIENMAVTSKEIRGRWLSDRKREQRKCVISKILKSK